LPLSGWWGEIQGAVTPAKIKTARMNSGISGKRRARRNVRPTRTRVGTAMTNPLSVNSTAIF
jgi:hypothetical protein